MTTIPCDEIQADALGLAALPADAPERLQAEAHALGCAACARALAEARGLMLALDAAAPPLPAPETLRAAAEPILRQLRAVPAREGGGRYAIAVAAAALAAWAVPLALASHPLGARHALAASLGLGIVAALSSAATVASAGIFAGAFPVFSAIFSLLASDGGGLHVHAGIHCALTELGAAAGAALLVELVTRRKATDDTTLLVAAAGGGALAGQAALHATCAASTELPHLLVFHTGALMAGTVLALAAAQILTARKPVSRAL
jgi:hypothetical protein